jgi:hypothetical protein
MQQNILHSFHIPVMGLAFSADSPLKVAQYGITSTISLSDDTLLEQLRQYYSRLNNKPYTSIKVGQEDYRAHRITAYLDLVDELVQEQVNSLKKESFDPGTRLTRYFTLLPESSPLKDLYRQMQETTDPGTKQQLQLTLRELVRPGCIDVNIMTKLDKANYTKTGEPLPQEYSDALAALRGFANSRVYSSVVFSAGMNMRLYGYLDQFSDFLPDQEGHLRKKVIIKVSDYRSAFVQGKILAKKGIWVSEFRIESGLNCGGHAFATDGYLIGPILEEFKQNRELLQKELFTLFSAALVTRGQAAPEAAPQMRITVQGGIGTAREQEFLLRHYQLEATGWGTPFLLVPEATTVDPETLEKLVRATADDLYLSPISPLGVPFNSLRGTSNEALKLERIRLGKPGSPCPKKHLSSSVEFTSEPVCTASRTYQKQKLEQLLTLDLPEAEYKALEASVLVKECLCEGLANTALLQYGISNKPATKAVAICPGPNLAYFSGIFSLQQMVDHIYGRFNALSQLYRPHMFINELRMYVSFWKNKKAELPGPQPDKNLKYLEKFWQELLKGISYYRQLAPQLFPDDQPMLTRFMQELEEAEESLQHAYGGQMIAG